MRKLIFRQESFPLKAPFKIAHGTRYESEVIYVEIQEGKFIGKGESYPYARYDETCESVLEQIANAKSEIENGMSLYELQSYMQAGSARAALDLALWDLESQKQNLPLWKIAGLAEPKAINTAYTLVIDEPEIIGKQAQDYANIYPILKLKLAGDGQDGERIMAVRHNAPNAKIVIDANESWNALDQTTCQTMLQICEQANVSMIEQPFKAGDDDMLSQLTTAITICADESCHTSHDLEKLQGKYQMINIKLDKTGGLTESLILLKKAKEMGFQIMVGCMVTTSLSIRPAYYLAQEADFADIDGPLLLHHDRPDGLYFSGAVVRDKR
jgi:L-alanine-DL-glutamate epimerase-like enolase superfamily enzyme